MKNIMWTLLSILIFATQTQGQTDTIPVSNGKNIQMRAGVGLAMFSGTGRLKNHFDKHGFNRTSRSFIPLFFGKNEQEYPKSNSIPLVGEVAVCVKVKPRAWASLVMGFDNWVNVEGYNGSALFIKKHKSWFFSPQYRVDVPESNFGLFAGPTLDFHKTKAEGEDVPVTKKTMKFGAMGGLQVKLNKYFDFLLAYRWTPTLRYGAQTMLRNGVTHILPAHDVGFSYLRAGISYNIDIGTHPWGY